MADEIKASPQSASLAWLAEKLRAARSAGDTVTIPYLGGAGTMILGKSPEEVTEWSYGNAPLHVPTMTRVPQFKKDRAESLADTLFAAQAAAPVARMAPRAARELTPAAGAMAMRAAEVGGMPVHGLGVIKNKGGNWLAGSVEGVTRDLKRAAVPIDKYEIRAAMTPEDLSKYYAAADAEGVTDLVSQLKAAGLHDKYIQVDPVNKWLETKLAKYIKNEMATPEDPLRALAEKGVSHLPIADLEQGTSWMPESIAISRMRGGFPVHGMAESPAAKGWEASADAFINAAPASQHTRPLTPSEVRLGYESTVKDNPWLLKVPPETPVYYPEFGKIGDSDMGFPHLVDELRNAINPESGLPANLRWKYADLDKVTVPQAVQRVHDINTWRAEQKAAADLMRANNAAAVLHKDYPDAPYKWVELKNPESKLGEGETIKYLPEVDMWGIYDPHGGTISSGVTEREAMGLLRREERQKALEDALKYEGETMGHCVGGYCPDVLEGRSRIFSLRNKKTGEPHVTVEVQPKKGVSLGQYMASLPEEEVANALKNPPLDIIQIKGKANRAPKEEYLPYVQDFVRSGKWGRVGDLENSGLMQVEGFKHGGMDPQIYEAVRNELGDYATMDDILNVAERHMGKKPEGFATGGLVDGATEYNPLEVDYIYNNVIRGYAEGGKVESTHLPYDEAKISSLVNALREELNA